MSVNYKVKIKDLPSDLMPRERLVALGSSALSNAELLALILVSGTRSENALEMCSRILAAYGGWRGLARLSQVELTQINGIGTAKACQIQALLEISRRIAASVPETRPTVRCPEDVANLVMEEMRDLDREHFRLVPLNTKNQVLGIVPVSVGSLNAAPVHPREVFKEAIRRSSAAIILLHNHPSGDPTPSREDIEITKRLAEAGKLLGIEVFDHLVIGDKRYVSLKEKGVL